MNGKVVSPSCTFTEEEFSELSGGESFVSKEEDSTGHRRQLDGTGQAISATQPAPAFSVNRKPCSLTIAETRLRPRPDPCVFRLLSDL